MRPTDVGCISGAMCRNIAHGGAEPQGRHRGHGTLAYHHVAVEGEWNAHVLRRRLPAGAAARTVEVERGERARVAHPSRRSAHSKQLGLKLDENVFLKWLLQNLPYKIRARWEGGAMVDALCALESAHTEENCSFSTNCRHHFQVRVGRRSAIFNRRRSKRRKVSGSNGGRTVVEKYGAGAAASTAISAV
jgi:hypothetical protein